MTAAKEQQIFNDDGTPRRKYELDDHPESRVGLRSAIGLVLANGFVLIKTVLFGQTATAATGPGSGLGTSDGGRVGDQDNGAMAQASAADTGSSAEAAEEEDAAGSSLPTSFLSVREPFLPAEPEQIDYVRTAGAAPVASNDNETLYGAQPGAGVDLSLPAAGRASSASGGAASGPGRANEAPKDEDDEEDDPDNDKGEDEDEDENETPTPPRVNRLPAITAPLILADLVSNQSMILALGDLLRNATDPDGDSLSVKNLTTSSGTLIARSDGSWMFTPDRDDTSNVTFTYAISDGKGEVTQTASVDLVEATRQAIVGTPGGDSIVATAGDDVIDALDGDDLIIGREGADIIYGGSGNDRILGDDGNDVIYAGDGDDVVFAGTGDDVVFGGEGDDTLFGEDGKDVLLGENGSDTISGGADNDVLAGGAGDDTLLGNDGDDLIDGGDGEDRVDGGAGDDVVIAGAGDDVVSGGAGDDTFLAAARDGDDVFDGGEGSDTYDLSGTTADAIVDLAAGTAASDDIGSDTLAGIENITGGSGDDTLVASEAVNELAGGAGADTFVFRSSLSIGSGRGSRDKILDFEVGDRIDLDDISDEFAQAIDTAFEDHGIRRFVLIGQQDEFAQPGQVRFKYDTVDDKPVTLLQGNIDGDADLEFELEISGHYAFTDSDFNWRA